MQSAGRASAEAVSCVSMQCSAMTRAMVSTPVASLYAFVLQKKLRSRKVASSLTTGIGFKSLLRKVFPAKSLLSRAEGGRREKEERRERATPPIKNRRTT